MRKACTQSYKKISHKIEIQIYKIQISSDCLKLFIKCITFRYYFLMMLFGP